MKIEVDNPEKLLAEFGDSIFTLKGDGVSYPFDAFRYRATGLNPDGSIAIEMVKEIGI